MQWYWVYDGPGVRDFATGIAVDGGGNCYVTGSSQGAGGTVAAATAKLNRLGASVWLKRLQYGDEGHCDATALVYRRVGGARRLFLTGSAMGLMATRQNLLIAEVSADTGARVHHAVVDGSGADDGGAALAVDASGNAFAAGWTTDVTSEVVHAFVARMSADGTVPWTDALWLPTGRQRGLLPDHRPRRRRQRRLRRVRRARRAPARRAWSSRTGPRAAAAGSTCPAAPPRPWTSAGR